VIDLAARERERHAALRPLQLRRRARRQQAVDVVAIARIGWRTPGGRVRVREQSELFQHGKLVADRGRPGADLGVGGERLRSDRLAGRREAVDHLR
jgi:hypothetical protein